ncbi:MAG: tetratricopeptide repeat protein [Tepidisphaeraceae bacterium]
MRTRYVLAALAIVLSFSGCKNDQDTAMIKGLSAEDANRLNAPRSAFETANDPPFNAETRFAAGRLAETQNAYPAAIAQYNEALKINPNYLPAMYRLAVVQTFLKQYPQAIEAWKRYVAASNGSADSYNDLGYTYELAGHSSEAEAAYRAGLARDPSNGPCNINLGLLLVRTDRVNEGALFLEKTLKPAEVHYNIGSVYQQLGKKEQAIEEFRKALELDPSMKEAKARLKQLQP